MATARETIETALRMIGRLRAGATARNPDAEDGLDALKGLYRAWITSGAFGRMADVIPTTDYTAGENQRIWRKVDTSTVQITLPDVVSTWNTPLPYDRERDSYVTNYEAVDGNNRPPRDTAVVVIVDELTGIVSDFIYDGMSRQWMAVNGEITGGTVQPMTLDSPGPLSLRDPRGLAACLAVEIADEFGADISATTLSTASRFKLGLVTHFSTPRQVATGSYF